MTQTSYPKGGGTTTDAQYADLFDSVIGTGVRAVGDLLVSADSTGLVVKVAPGFATVAGSAFNSTAIEPLTVAANATGATRIDTVVLTRDTTQANVVTLAIVTGGAAAPSLTQVSNGVWQEPLADVAVPNGAATIIAANVTDRRRYMSSRVKAWTTANRPVGRAAQLGYNLTTSTWEFHNGTAWGPLTLSSITASQISDPQNISAGKINGQNIFIQQAQPTGAAVNDLWFW